eukprot:1159368-Pelagomonas_calceolata.AAC.4
MVGTTCGSSYSHPQPLKHIFLREDLKAQKVQESVIDATQSTSRLREDVQSLTDWVTSGAFSEQLQRRVGTAPSRGGCKGLARTGTSDTVDVSAGVSASISGTFNAANVWCHCYAFFTLDAIPVCLDQSVTSANQRMVYKAECTTWCPLCKAHALALTHVEANIG